MEALLEKPLTIDLSTAKVGAIINTSSGGCDLESELEMMNILQAHGVAHPLMWCGGAEDMENAFKKTQEEKLDVLIVLGGDGTIRRAAEIAGAEEPILIPLPGGTMNILPKALYGERSWQEALQETLAAPYKRTISGGKVGNRQFFITAIIGGPALFAEAREAIREGELLEAWEKGRVALEQSLETSVHYKIGTEEGDVETVAIICPLVSQKLNEHAPFFEVAIIDVHSFGEVVALGSYAAFGEWREDSHVQIAKADRVQISGGNSIPAILDGERADFQDGAQIEFLPQAFTVLVPLSKP